MTDINASPQKTGPGIMGRITSTLDRVMQSYLPDPFVIVILLTLLVFGLGIAVEGASPAEMVTYFGDGFWNLLGFSMQMALILVTGFILASSPLFSWLLGRLARLARTPGQAIILVTLVAMTASWLNWGFGLVIGALFAKRLGQEVPDTDFRVLVAAGYSGFLIQHAGLSGSVPLTAATPGNFLEEEIGLYSTAETIFAPFNLILVGAMVILLPIVNRMMLNHGGTVVRAGDVPQDDQDLPAPTVTPASPASRLEHASWLGILIGAFGLFYIVLQISAGQFGLTLDMVNYVFLFLGLGLHGSAAAFLGALKEAVKGVGGILIQFPFYAGVMGMMVGSGLAASLTDVFVSGANATMLPLLAFLSAAVVNVLVPSGGGQWAIQGPIIMPAAQALGADEARVIMAVAWGDAWTNMIQPFWALPALAVAGLSARDIMGFCVMVLLVSGLVLIPGLMFLP